MRATNPLKMNAYKLEQTTAHDSKVVSALPTSKFSKLSNSEYNPHQIDRKGSLAGYPMPELKAKLPTEKTGKFNKSEIKRPSFYNVAILPRQIPDFDKLEALNISQFGQKVQFDPELAEKYFGENNKVNSKLSQKLQEIQQNISAGREEGRDERKVMAGNIAVLLQETKDFRDVTNAEFKDMTELISELNLPENPMDYGIDAIYADQTYFNDNQGKILLYLLNKVKRFRGVNASSKPFRNADGQPIKVSTAISSLGKKRDDPTKRYLYIPRDSETIYLVPSNTIIEELANDGIKPDDLPTKKFAIRRTNLPKNL